ncbi:hypothetical protein MUS_2006 [Bacillus velezensis YAU B9601-Y2]|uniref:Uncharacterized protein n=1 Tax=Bacillus amyloliquefaciens (strain Y2) TaxID=1155777 RepID=I2C5P9_BACAY|nr:hypothetical protein MUS_2006 [Bacillus velezensis YAU B9601-Y2]RUS01120.1 hypothetical protein EFW58_01151 [Bacillus velezensis]
MTKNEREGYLNRLAEYGLIEEEKMTNILNCFVGYDIW